jgi:hypothetical protein
MLPSSRYRALDITARRMLLMRAGWRRASAALRFER